MLLLLTFLAAGVVGFAISKKTSSDGVEVIAAVVSITSFLSLTVCLAVFGIQAITEDAAKAEMQAKHDAIIQMVGDKSNVVTLTRDISEYNGEILSGREMQKSPWIGIFVYDFWDDLPTIEIGHLEHVG